MSDNDSLTVSLDDARALMYDDLTDILGDDAVDDELERAVQRHLTQLYDNRDELLEQVAQGGQ